MSRSKALSVDVLERETDMAVKCEPDRYDLRDLQELQARLEVSARLMSPTMENNAEIYSSTIPSFRRRKLNKN